MTMLSQNTPNKLSRRHWLRDAAIATTSAAVLPSLLTGCMDHPLDPGKGGLGSSPPLSLAELKMASDNLINMAEFIEALKNSNIERAHAIHDLLKADHDAGPKDFKDLLIDVFSEIGMGILEVAEVELPGVGPAIAVASEFLKQWSNEETDRRGGLNTTVGLFLYNYQTMMETIHDRLIELSTPGNDLTYTNLKTKWKDVEFLGKTYSLRQLAYSDFPCQDKGCKNGDQFVALSEAAKLRFEKYFWNALIVKLGVRKGKPFLTLYPPAERPNSALAIAQERFYGQKDVPNGYDTTTFPGAYIGGVYYEILGQGNYYFYYWWFEIDDLPLSKEVADILFIDDTPGRIMNPDDKGNPKTGFWPREHVYKQFYKEKPDDWGDWQQLGNDRIQNSDHYKEFGKLLRNYEFTGGSLRV